MRVLNLVLLIIFTSCASLDDQLKKLDKLEARAKKEGFFKSPKSAVKKLYKTCQTPKDGKWNIKIDKNSPLVLQKRRGGGSTYGAFKIVCLKVKKNKKYAFTFYTKHQGGGSGKSFYSYPIFHVFNQKLKKYKVPMRLVKGHTFVSGDYTGDFVINSKSSKKVYILIESDNRYPTVPWGSSEVSTGYASIPLTIFNSVYGEINLDYK